MSHFKMQFSLCSSKKSQNLFISKKSQNAELSSGKKIFESNFFSATKTGLTSAQVCSKKSWLALANERARNEPVSLVREQ